MSSDDGILYRVVVNDEAQYSIWFADRPAPDGWAAVDKTGTRAECLAHIDQVWLDHAALHERAAS